VYRYIALPFYRISVRIRKRFEKSFGPAKNKFFYPLVAKPVIHVVVIVLIFGVTATNLQARSVPNSGGQGSILFQAVGGDSIELIEETADQVSQTQVTSYLGAAYGLSQRQLASAEAIAVSDNLALVTTGGSSISATPSLTGAIRESGTPRKVRTRSESYVVLSGDTISTIASSFGLSSSTILWANDLGTNDYIRPGQELAILPTDGVEHDVTSGDTLSKLAKKYDVEESEILKANKLADADALVDGRTILIPGGTPPRSAPPAPRLVSKPTIKNIGDAFTAKPDSTFSPEAGSPSMVWPTSGRVITQYWGWRHTGLDIDGHYDSPIYASDGGIVEISGWGNGYGFQIVINHENGFKTRYAHASKMFVNVGQRVTKGEVIAMVGTTGFSTGTHLHYEIYVNGVRRNPLLYVR
jgi:murein DD-endopeptidase MepM/ murein hydrolase activator NlpD